METLNGKFEIELELLGKMFKFKFKFKLQTRMSKTSHLHSSLGPGLDTSHAPTQVQTGTFFTYSRDVFPEA